MMPDAADPAILRVRSRGNRQQATCVNTPASPTTRTHARTHAHRADRVKQSIVRRRAAYPRCARNDTDLIISEYPFVVELRAIGLANMTAILSRSA